MFPPAVRHSTESQELLDPQRITLDGRFRHATLLRHNAEFFKQSHGPNNYQTLRMRVNKMVFHWQATPRRAIWEASEADAMLHRLSG
jgi:hypothetical protein